MPLVIGKMWWYYRALSNPTGGLGTVGNEIPKFHRCRALAIWMI